MPGVITLSGVETADNSDILGDTRLQTGPRGGQFIFEAEANLNTSANYVDITLQLPDGNVPLTAVRVPAEPNGVTGVLDVDTKYLATFFVQQGGHAVFSCNMEGAGAELTWRVTFRPLQ